MKTIQQAEAKAAELYGVSWAWTHCIVFDASKKAYKICRKTLVSHP